MLLPTLPLVVRSVDEIFCLNACLPLCVYVPVPLFISILLFPHEFEGVTKSFVLSQEQSIRRYPTINAKGLKASIVYYDG
jgi:hypothetical protein